MKKLRARIVRERFPAIETFMIALREKKRLKLKEMIRPPII
jgi:hypothetical protein